MNKAILNTLANIKNSSKTQKPITEVIYSEKAMQLCDVLYTRGFISGYRRVGNKIRIQIKFFNQKKALIHDIKMYSTPGRKLFLPYRSLLKNHALFDNVMLSTTSGLLLLEEAYQLGLGGELLFKIN